MDKLYEILVAYEGETVDLIKLPKEEINGKIDAIVSSGQHGKLYVIEIDTLIGTALVNTDAQVICYYDQAPLADIVVANNRLSIKPQANQTFYIEKTIQELTF